MIVDYSHLRSQYDHDGYVVVRQFLDPDELELLTSNVSRFLHEVVPELPDTQVFYDLRQDGTRTPRQIHRMNVDPFFEEYRAHPKWNALAVALLGEPARARPPMWLNKPPRGDHSTPPHQDNIAFCLQPPSGVQLFLAIDPIDAENGCLRYLAGSHVSGLRPHAYSGVRGFSLRIVDFTEAEAEAEAAIELGPGDLVGHHPNIVHRAMPNRSTTRSRAAFAMTFEGASARIDDKAMAEFERSAAQALREGR